MRLIITGIAAFACAMMAGGCTSPTSRMVAATPVAMPAERMIDIDGTRVRVREEGQAGAPVIVLIHGFTFSLESWDGWAADLSRDHRVIRYDLSGHGLSAPDPQRRYGTDGRVEQLRRLLDMMGVERATFAGNSFGGLVAWTFAARYPDRVERLVLLNSAGFSINGVTDTPVPVPAAMRAYLLAPTPAGVGYSAAMIYAHPERLPPARLEQMRAMIARNGPELVAHLEHFTLPDPVAMLGRIRASTLVMWGANDKVVPVDHAARLVAAIPQARSIIYQDVGHAPHEEATDRTLSDLRVFFRENQ